MTGPEEWGSHPTAPRRPDACCSHLGYGLGSSPLSIPQFEFSPCSPVLFLFFPPLFFYLLCSVSAPQALSSRMRMGFGSQRTEERMGHCWHLEHVQGEEESTKAEAAAVLGRGGRGRKTSSSSSASRKENNPCQPAVAFFSSQTVPDTSSVRLWVCPTSTRSVPFQELQQLPYQLQLTTALFHFPI